MMSGRLYIDGNDAYRQWGVYVVKDGWNEAISYPPLKTPDANDWHEEDGLEADLSSPQLDTMEAAISFAWQGHYSRLLAFVEALSDGAYHEFDCASIGRSFTLRMSQMPKLDMAQSLGFVSIKFCNDFPLRDYSYAAPRSGMARVADYLIDGLPFTDYGCRILQGSRAEIAKAPAVKQNLLRNVVSKPGATYDGKKVTFKSKDVKLKCLMRAETLAELWQNYDALLFDLIRPDERMLEVADMGQVFPCCYKSQSVTCFCPQGKIWLAFTLTLTFTHSMLDDDEDCLLVTDDGDIIVYS